MAFLPALGIPGTYRARLHTRDGHVVERVVGVPGGTKTRVQLTPPAQVAGSFGPLTPRPLPVILHQAAQVFHPEMDWTERLVRLGQAPFPHDGEGCRIIFGVEPSSAKGASKALNESEVRLGSLDDATGKQLEPDRSEIPGVRVFTSAAKPGPYRLWWSYPGRSDQAAERIEFALALLPGRLCQLIFHQDSKGQIQISQFAPESHPRTPPPLHIPQTLDRLQRDLQAGKGCADSICLEELGRAQEMDPVAACIELYLQSGQGKPKELGNAADKVIAQFRALPDGYVARARSLEAAGQQGAASEAYRAALERGLPVLLPFLRFLWQGVKKHKLDHKRVALLDEANQRRIPLLLWSAWRTQAS